MSCGCGSSKSSVRSIVLLSFLIVLCLSSRVVAGPSIFDHLDRSLPATDDFESIQSEFNPTFGSEIEFWSNAQVRGALKGPAKIMGTTALLQLGGLIHWTLIPMNLYGVKYAKEQASEEGLFLAMEKGANKAADKKFTELLVLIRDFCVQTEQCVVEELKHKTDYGREWDGFTVSYPDGWWFRVTKDIAVLEILMKPTTVKEFVQVWPRFQRDLFQKARSIGLWVPKLDGPWNGGHINIGINSSFGEDHLLLRNFIVDLINHNNLFNGLLVKDRQNAKTFSWEEFRSLKAMIADYDKGQFRSVDSFFEALGQAVKLERKHYFSIRRAFLENVDARTIELRGFRSQKSASEYGRWIVLLRERMRYLRGIRKPIELDPYAVAKEDKFSQLRKFRRYVSESNLPFNKYLELIPKTYHKHTKHFAYSAREKARQCAGEFLF